MFASEEMLPFGQGREQGFYFIHQGFVKLSFAYENVIRPIDILEAGDIVGQLFENPSLGLLAKAVDFADVQYIRIKEFNALAARAPELDNLVTAHSQKTLLKALQRAVVLQLPDLRARVAGTLMTLSREESQILPPIDRTTFADLAATVSDSASRIISEFDSQGLIIREGKRVRILKRKKLAEKLNLSKK
ncbi:MAG: helix-turn-helix domain-containing protein [Bdellovibrionota bacterium]